MGTEIQQESIQEVEQRQVIQEKAGGLISNIKQASVQVPEDNPKVIPEVVPLERTTTLKTVATQQNQLPATQLSKVTTTEKSFIVTKIASTIQESKTTTNPKPKVIPKEQDGINNYDSDTFFFCRNDCFSRACCCLSCSVSLIVVVSF